jgi:glycosyltransferase involved in cell wall biosynthesis
MVGEIPHGISRYVTRLAEGLLEIREKNGLFYDPIFLVNRGKLPEVFSRFAKIETGVGYLSICELVEIPLLLARTRADLYHSPSLSSLVYCPCPWIQTLHDLNHLDFGSAAKRLYYRTVLRQFARGARKLLTVSEFSRTEISRWLEVPDEAVQVVPNSVERDLPRENVTIESKFEKMGIKKRKFFLCFSNPMPHKNVETLVHAFESFAREDWKLVLNLDASFSKPGVVALGRIPEAEASWLRENASAVFFPSLYEGFGLPPIEALVSGVPVVISDIPAHREGVSVLDAAALNGAIYWANPRIESEWISGMEKVSRGELRGLSAASVEILLKTYSSNRLASTMDRLYSNVLESRS